MLAPCIIEFGNEEQKREHLPKIIKGEIRWCQGYSEPGSGSDLASLSTKAEDIGDHYLVNVKKSGLHMLIRQIGFLLWLELVRRNPSIVELVFYLLIWHQRE